MVATIVTQVAVELGARLPLPAAVTQVAVEIGLRFRPPTIVTQVAFEIGLHLAPPAAVTQVAVEVGVKLAGPPPTALPFLPRNASTLAALFRKARYPGRRAPAPMVESGSGPSPTSPSPYQQRLLRIRAEHFQPRPVPRYRLGKTPISATSPIRPFWHANRVVALHLQAIATHFAHPRFPGGRLRGAFYYPGAVGAPARASQAVIEALVSTLGAGRASQLILEALARTNAPARASQVTLEALIATAARVRASQVVLEVLVPGTESPLLPTYPALIGLTFSVIKRPKLSVVAATSSSGREIRVNYWANPQWEWDLTYDILADGGGHTGTTESDLKTIIGFFLDRRGSYAPFYFLDPDDNAVTGQALGISDGVTKVFPAVRTYGLGGFTGTEPVGTVNTDLEVNVYLNNVLQDPSTYSVNTTTPGANYILFNNPHTAGLVVTADFSFKYFCRLKDDNYDFEKFMSLLWSTQKITIFSLKAS